MSRRPQLAALAVGLFTILALAGCKSSTGPSSSLTGQWNGLVGTPVNRSADMKLTQSGSNVTGTMSIVGAYNQTAITGTVAGGVLSWTVTIQCQTWTGTASLSSGNKVLSGPLSLTDSCNPGNDVTATLTLNRQ